MLNKHSDILVQVVFPYYGNRSDLSDISVRTTLVTRGLLF